MRNSRERSDGRMSEKKIGVAIAGLGFVGARAHVPAFRKIPGAEVVGVIGRPGGTSEHSAKELSEKHGFDYYLDYEAALDDSRIDAVVVAVPTPLHFEMASKAISKGKHVLCEMPLATTIPQARYLRQQAKMQGVLLMPVLNFRFTPSFVKAKELIDKGAVGKPMAVSFREFIAAKDLAAQWPLTSWAWDVKKSGGLPDFTLSVWSIDLVRWLLGTEIKSVHWTANYAPVEGVDDFEGYHTMGIIKLANGTVGTLHYGSTLAPGLGTSSLEVYGSNGKILQAMWNNSLALIGENLEKEEWAFEEKGPRVWGHYQLDSYFIDCILQGKTPSFDADDAIKAQAIAGKMVQLRPERRA